MSQKLRIGISYDSPEEYPEITGPADKFAEFEPESTISAMEDAIRFLGCNPVRIGGPRALIMGRPDVDVVWNISEGYGTRNRESWVPVLSELYGIPCLGSDAMAQTLSLDKAQTKKFARDAGIPTSDWLLISTHNQLPESLLMQRVTDVFGQNPWPMFVKPRYEGTGKGITPRSVCHSVEQLLTETARQCSLYAQDVLVERFLPGAEYTVAVSGTPLRAHPVLERGLDATTGIGIHILEALHTRNSTSDAPPPSYTLSHQLSIELEARLRTWSLRLCQEMEILDYARLDFKLDERGNPHFLEINPLPTFAIDNTFAILAELESRAYDEFLAEILKAALVRLGFAV